MELEEICRLVARTARTIGIEIVRDLDPVDYGKFLKEREAFLVEHRKRLDELKEAKILRTGS